jgi:hypothetical protein
MNLHFTSFRQATEVTIFNDETGYWWQGSKCGDRFPLKSTIDDRLLSVVESTFMKISKKRIGPFNSGKSAHVPPAARIINTAIAIVLFGISIYHFTQPNEAWRSGTIELVSAMLLLTAAYRVSYVKAMVTNIVVAVGISALGVRHLIYGGGWGSGITELLFAVLLVTAASMIHRDRGK